MRSSPSEQSTALDTFEALLGPTLISRGAHYVQTREALAGKSVVGLFFTAGVCDRCRAFTPAISAVYRNRQLAMYQHLTIQEDMEIVMISMDANAQICRDYLAQTPFLALPQSRRDLKHQLLKRYDVKRIPSVIFVDANTETIERDGRALVDQHHSDLRVFWKMLQPNNIPHGACPLS